MKIFLSHSSKNKPLVREIKSFLPEHMKLWIDEKDILVGDNIIGSIKEAIKTNSDFLIVFLDTNSIKSEWVVKELNWAIEHEKQINRTFILPIIIEPEVLSQQLPFDLINRKYLSCYDFNENSIKNLADSIMSELFAWLSRDLDGKAANKDSSSLKILNEADQFIAKVADHVRLIVYSFHRGNPLEIEKLFQIISSKEDFKTLSYAEFRGLLERFQQLGYLSGIVCDGVNIFIEEEHFAWKTGVFSDAKSRIAKMAVSLIRSNFIILMDAGSTTLEVARQIGLGLKMKAWKNLRIITNSLAAANEILQVASELGWDDSTSLVEVYIIGGRIRANTLAVVNDNVDFKNNQNDDFKNMTSLTGVADISFIGANGIHIDHGFSTNNEIEVYTKKDLMTYAKRNIILADPSKFGIKEERVFATFNDNLEIITVKDAYEEIIEKYRELLESTNTKIITN
jgi:DeoR/GlpR family transcriptional regulator of sugar metabolism